MAPKWKLRKDRLQEDTPPEAAPQPTESQEGPGLADTAVPLEPMVIGPAEEPHTGLTFDSESSPFIFAPAEPDLAVPVEEPQFRVSEPTFDAEPFSAGPFTPFEPEEPALASSPETAFTLLDREEVAPSLVHSDGDSDVPRVSPFIVDVPPEAEAAPPPVQTLIVRIGNFSANFSLTNDVTVIGRPDSLLQSYPDVEIELDDAVSRRHAEIRRQDGGYAVVDLDSTNGTLLNGERLDPHRPSPLAHGDRIRVGDRTEIVFE